MTGMVTEAMVEALKPFAAAIARYDAEWSDKTGGQAHAEGEDEEWVTFLGRLGDYFNMVTIGDFRRAATALSILPTEGKEEVAATREWVQREDENHVPDAEGWYRVMHSGDEERE